MSSRGAQEDLSKNPFLQALQANFEGIYRQAAQRGERTVILVPCAERLEAKNLDQFFVESHVLQASPVPGCYMNNLGQGVEVKDNSVNTQLGFQETRVCEVLQKDSMFDLGKSFNVLVIDKPLVGASTSRPKPPGPTTAQGTGSLDDLLSSSSTMSELHDEVYRFRKTFVQVPGCENRTAERIREIVAEAVDKLARLHNVTSGTQLAQLEFKVSREAYGLLSSFVFPHLQSTLTEKEERLQRQLRSYSPDELLKAVPGGERLRLADVSQPAAELEQLEDKIAPHEKIECVDKAHSLLQLSIGESQRSRPTASAPLEITGDDILSLFILVVHRSRVKNFLAHVCHMEMYLQWPSRSGGNARFEEAGYAVSALQAGLQFFMEEGRSARAGPPAAPPTKVA